MRSAVFLALLALVSFAALVQASSHGEAPGVLANPPSDATDLYAFVSYEPGREKYVTILALYNPLQQPIAGPNYFPLSNDYFYEILVDTTGDGIEEYLFTFDVSSELEDDGGLKVKVGPKGNRRKVSVPLKVIGQIDASKDDFSNVLNYRDTYTLSVTNKKKKSTKRVKEAGSKNTVFTIPFDNAGEKTIPNYSSYARKYVYDIDLPFCNKDGKVFVGQRQEPFFIALGETFDLVNYQGNKLPLADAPGGVINSKANNDIAGFNIDVLALEIPIKCLGDNDVIGVWTRTRSKATGRQNQRLGNPLVNELVIGLEDKDKWNKVTPKDDDLFKEYFEYPAFAELLDILFAAAAGAPRISPTNFPRKDLNIPLQKGLPGLNRLTDGRLADMLRVNTSIPPTPQFSQNNLGVAGGDLAGYPNGRRPGDDVVDITLRVVMGVLCHTAFGPVLDCSPEDAPTGTLPFSDGADGDATDFPNRFPYLNDPLPGARIF